MSLVNPFKKGTAMGKLFDTLSRARRPLTADEVARHAKVRKATARNMLAAMRNPMHNVPMRKVGVQVRRAGDGFLAESCKAEPDAKRPPRG